MKGLIFLLLAMWGTDLGIGEMLSGSVRITESGVDFSAGQLDPNGSAAYGTFDDGLLKTGWGVLNIKAGYSAKFPGNQQLMYAAGYLEGSLTQKHMYMQYQNIKDTLGMNDETENNVKQFFKDQDMFVQKMIKQAPQTDPYWRHMSYVYQQYRGLMDGYSSAAPRDQELEEYAFQLLNGLGDVIDLTRALNETKIDHTKMTKEELKAYILKNSHCSALIKILPGFENLFMSHSAWYLYYSTDRIFKYYDFNLKDPATKSSKMGFSSYPGMLTSLDDYYLLSNGVVMIQTTNNVFNHTLYNQVTSQSNLAWHRVRLAHMMSQGGEEWANIFKLFNSGTYNNQYMILDLNKVVLKETIHDDALWVVEQIPGLVMSEDVTKVLRTGYWPSYNVPYFERIFNLSGYGDVVKTKGEDFSYQLAPRAKIFRRDANQVKDMKSMQAIMRYNDYLNDPYSEGDSCNTICCRGDLKKNPKALGCYDTKVSDLAMARNLEAFAVNGPTLGNGLKPFSWSGVHFNTTTHMGLPDVYNFPFVYMKPKTL